MPAALHESAQRSTRKPWAKYPRFMCGYPRQFYEYPSRVLHRTLRQVRPGAPPGESPGLAAGGVEAAMVAERPRSGPSIPPAGLPDTPPRFIEYPQGVSHNDDFVTLADCVY